MLTKSFILALALSSPLVMTQPALAEAAEIAMASVPVTNVFAPKGFDTNDNTEVIVTGFLPDLCYQNPTTEYEVNEATKEITINLKARHLSQFNGSCIEVMVPFIETVKVGPLDRGDYSVVVNKDENSERRPKNKLEVEEARSSAVDNHIYAQVEYIQRNHQNKTMVTLVGTNPSNCFTLDRVEFVSNGFDTYSVLPILKKTAAACPAQPTPFAYEVKIPESLTSGEVLLHVRSMEGKSVNVVVR